MIHSSIHFGCNTFSFFCSLVLFHTNKLGSFSVCEYNGFIQYSTHTHVYQIMRKKEENIEAPPLTTHRPSKMSGFLRSEWNRCLVVNSRTPPMDPPPPPFFLWYYHCVSSFSLSSYICGLCTIPPVAIKRGDQN